MATREKGFGFTAELADKMAKKFDVSLAKQGMDWMFKVIGERSPPVSTQENVQEALKDGVALCKLANAIKPGSVKKVASSKMAFKMMENINGFLQFCDTISIQKSDLFQTVDLYEGQNIPQVINTIHAVGRKANKVNSSIPSLGPKEAQKNQREFSKEQLRSGDGIIGLQAGTNRGANQAGMNFGKQRQIM